MVFQLPVLKQPGRYRSMFFLKSPMVTTEMLQSKSSTLFFGITILVETTVAVGAGVTVVVDEDEDDIDIEVLIEAEN
jgi:hypothetical protein